MPLGWHTVEVDWHLPKNRVLQLEQKTCLTRAAKRFCEESLGKLLPQNRQLPHSSKAWGEIHRWKPMPLAYLGLEVLLDFGWLRTGEQRRLIFVISADFCQVSKSCSLSFSTSVLPVAIFPGKYSTKKVWVEPSLPIISRSLSSTSCKAFDPGIAQKRKRYPYLCKASRAITQKKD